MRSQLFRLGRASGRKRPALLIAVFALGLLTPVAAVAVVTGFSDVPADHTHAEGIAYVSDTGITAGYSDGTYRPEQPVTRGQMASFLYRMAGQNVAAGIRVRHQAGQTNAQIVDAFNNVNRVGPAIVTGGPGNYLINMGFDVGDKMLQVTAIPVAGNTDVVASAGPSGAANTVVVNLYDISAGGPSRGEFYLLVYGR